jgi:hypothetical protein
VSSAGAGAAGVAVRPAYRKSWSMEEDVREADTTRSAALFV